MVSSEGSTPKLTQLAVGRILFLVGRQHEGLVSLLPVACKSRSVPRHRGRRVLSGIESHFIKIQQEDESAGQTFCVCSLTTDITCHMFSTFCS